LIQTIFYLIHLRHHHFANYLHHHLMRNLKMILQRKNLKRMSLRYRMMKILSYRKKNY
jgi:hypothetical protein